MGDIISRADAICEVLVNDGIDNIVDRINALPSAEAYFTDGNKIAEWIHVSERLPEYRKTVLISTFWGVKTGYLDSTEAYGDFWEIIEEDGTAALHSVYAWQPLPAPYKGGDTK